MGLLVSGSYDAGDSACDVACDLMMLFVDLLSVVCDMRPGDTGDEAISESHECIDLSPADGSSVHFYSSEL